MASGSKDPQRVGEWGQEGGEWRNTDGWTSKGMWMKVRELQAGSGMPSGEEDRSTEMTSKPDVTGHQNNNNKKKNPLSILFSEMSPSSPVASR